MNNLKISFETKQYPDDLDYCNVFDFKLFIDDKYVGYLKVKYIDPIVLKSKITHPLLHLNKLHGQVITQEQIDNDQFEMFFDNMLKRGNPYNLPENYKDWNKKQIDKKIQEILEVTNDKIKDQVGIHFYKPYTDDVVILDKYKGNFYSIHLYKFASKYIQDHLGLNLHQSSYLLEDGEKLWKKLESHGYCIKNKDGELCFFDKDAV